MLPNVTSCHILWPHLISCNLMSAPWTTLTSFDLLCWPPVTFWGSCYLSPHLLQNNLMSHPLTPCHLLQPVTFNYVTSCHLFYPMWHQVTPFDLISPSFNPCDLMGPHVIPCDLVGPMRPPVNSFLDPLWNSHLTSCDPIWPNDTSFDPLWLHVTQLDLLSPPFTTVTTFDIVTSSDLFWSSFDPFPVQWGPPLIVDPEPKTGGRSNSGSRTLNTGSRTQNTGSRTQNPGSKTETTGSRTQNTGSRTQNSGSKTQTTWSRPQNTGSRTQNSGPRDRGPQDPKFDIVDTKPLGKKGSTALRDWGGLLA